MSHFVPETLGIKVWTQVHTHEKSRFSSKIYEKGYSQVGKDQNQVIRPKTGQPIQNHEKVQKQGVNTRKRWLKAHTQHTHTKKRKKEGSTWT